MRYIAYLFVLAPLMGCATSRFIESGQSQLRPAKAPEQVALYYSPQDVPFAYSEIGRIFMNQTHNSKGKQVEQILKIRNRAANIGADAVILIRKTNMEGEGGWIGNLGAASTRTVYDVEGIAIMRTGEKVEREAKSVQTMM
jgi:hypothetical protein